MRLSLERRLLQLLVAIAALLPLLAGIAGVTEGVNWVDAAHQPTIDLDSHFAYLSGILLAVGIGLLSCVPRIEATGGRFRLLGAIVICGGLARLLSLLTLGTPSTPHIAGLIVEIVIVPLLLLWQAALAGRWRRLRIPLI